MKKNGDLITSKKKVGIRFEILERSSKESMGFVDWFFPSDNIRTASRTTQSQLIESKGLIPCDHILIPFSSIYEIVKLDSNLFDKYATKSISYK